MELFKLLGTIAIDNSDANKALDETTDKGSQVGGKLEKAFGAIGKGAVAVGKTVGAGMIAAGTAITGLVTKSVQAYASYEQLVGGVETLFKDSADVVLQYAENAYKTAGLSANAYMETVTSFSASLIQGLGGDTEKAAEYANMAITDMSDNANKMGTSMESIQNAYQGFAKQNYTMLDNLKLGYGGTQQEMYRLMSDAQKLDSSFDAVFSIDSKGHLEADFADIVRAIHIVQDNMGITGTTAQEADKTISGSISSMKSSWENLMTAMSDKDADFGAYINRFVDSVVTVGNNVLPVVETAIGGAIRLIDQLAPIIISKLPGFVSTLLPILLESAIGLINSLVAALPGIVSSLIDILPDIIRAVMELASGVASAIPKVIKTLVSAISSQVPSLLSGVDNLITSIAEFIQTNLPVVTEKAKDLVEGLGQKIQENLPSLISKGLDILLGLSQSLLDNVPTLVATGMDLIKSLAIGLVNALPELLAKAPTIISNLANTISRSMQTIFMKGAEIVWELIKGIVNAIPDLVKNFPKIIQAIFDVWNAVNWVNLGKNLISGIAKGIKNMGSSLKNTADDVLTKLNNLITNAFKAIGNAIMNPINTAKNLFSAAVSGIKNFAVSGFNTLKSSVTSVFNGIKNAITNPIQTAKNTIKGIVDAIKGFFSFKINFPKIPMPHFSVKPKGWSIGDLLKGSIPSLGIDWYAKAMNEPMIMTRPTIFGYNGATGELMGGGEAGSEVISGTNTLMQMIKSAVAAQNDTLTYYLQKLIEMLAEYFPEALEAMRTPATFDPEYAAAALAVPMDRQLGVLAAQKGRGR